MGRSHSVQEVCHPQKIKQVDLRRSDVVGLLRLGLEIGALQRKQCAVKPRKWTCEQEEKEEEGGVNEEHVHGKDRRAVVAVRLGVMTALVKEK